MNKIKKMLVLFILSGICLINVNAKTYPDSSNYDLNNWQEINLDLGGSYPSIEKIIETQDHNYLMLALYKESDKLIPGMNANGEVTSGTYQKDHTKIVKYDQNFNKIFEKDFYVLLNWENPDPLAPTIGTTANGIFELADGTFMIYGFTFGLDRENYPLGGQDDDFDAIQVRFDKDGNEIYQKHYYNEGIDQATSGAALKDGGYVIKYYYAPTKISATDVKKPVEFPTTKDERNYYVVYNSNNEIVDSFPTSQSEKLDALDFIDREQITYMKYEPEGPKFYDYDNNEELIEISPSGLLLIRSYKEKGVILRDANGNIVASDGLTNIKELKKSFVLTYSEATIFFNDDTFLNYDTLYDKNFKVLSIFNNVPGKDTPFPSNKCDEYFVASDGTIIAYNYKDYRNRVAPPHRGQGNKIFITKPITSENTNTFDANFIIGDKKISFNPNAFVENERTYVNLNNLCSMMDCTFTRSTKNPNQIIIRFDIMKNNAQIPSDFTVYDSKTPPTYTITHEIGTREYKSYFEIPQGSIFLLSSPTFNADSVDVLSKEINGQVYVPLRFISEALGRYVEYIPEGEDGKPTIKISAQGEGEFYERYSVGISPTNLNVGDVITDDIGYSNNPMELTKTLYAYSVDKSTNTVIGKDTTIFYPFTGLKPNREDHEDVAYTLYNTDYFFDHVATWDGIFVAKNNSIHREAFSNAQDNEEYYDEMIVTTAAISNIEGYPFVRMINLK